MMKLADLEELEPNAEDVLFLAFFFFQHGHEQMPSHDLDEMCGTGGRYL